MGLNDNWFTHALDKYDPQIQIGFDPMLYGECKKTFLIFKKQIFFFKE